MNPSDDDYLHQVWSNATWGWIAGIAVVVLVVLAAMFGG